MVRAWRSADVAACRAVSNPAWCRIFREISCFSILGHCEDAPLPLNGHKCSMISATHNSNFHSAKLLNTWLGDIFCKVSPMAAGLDEFSCFVFL